MSFKVKELEDRETESDPNVDNKQIDKSKDSTDKKDVINCRECEGIFSDKRSLNIHIKEQHPKRFKCTNCDKIFDSRWRLENHMQEHETRMEFKCDQCNKEFYLKWRLDKHVRGHGETDQKFCHYFNNQKICPFEKIGCKFRHEIAAICNFGQVCKNPLCQHRHIESKDNYQIEATEEEIRINEASGTQTNEIDEKYSRD